MRADGRHRSALGCVVIDVCERTLTKWKHVFKSAWVQARMSWRYACSPEHVVGSRFACWSSHAAHRIACPWLACSVALRSSDEFGQLSDTVRDALTDLVAAGAVHEDEEG
jgi:hypothetical protein